MMLSVSDFFLTTDRLGFRCWRDEDLGLAISLWGDPDVTRLIDARGTLTPDDVRARLVHEIATERAHGVQYWPIFLRETGELAGCCGLRPYGDSPTMREAGVHIRQAYWRKGYASEAMRAVIDHAFERLGVETLFAGHNPRNDASRALLEKLGFRWVRDELYPPTGLMHPSYELRRGEWSRRC